MIAFEAILLPDNSIQIPKPLITFSRPRRIIITVLDEEVDAQSGLESKTVEHSFFAESNTLTSVAAWSPHSTRVPNLHAGLIQVSADFDAPLPDSLWLGEEESEGSAGAIS